jgi:Dolichyl-phosphate-mannose-protein mannosyltransferase
VTSRGTRPAAAATPTAPGPRLSVTLGVVAAFVVLTLVEVAWFVWFESQPLPNGNNIPRWSFPARALPGVVIDGLTFAQSYLGLALTELSHVGNLPQRLPIVAAAGLIAAAALGLGGMVLRALRLTGSLSVAERWGSAFGIGASGLGVVTLVLGRLGWLGPWSARAGLGAIAAAELVLLVREWRERRDKPGASLKPPSSKGSLPSRVLPYVGFLAVVGPFLVMMVLGSMLPTIDYDALEYHLQGPKEYFQAGRITFLPHNVYTSMPFGVEMLHLLGMEVLDDWWWGALAGQLLVALHAPLAALMIALVVRRAGSSRAARFAALVYLTTPWIYRLAVLPYVEGPLGYYHAALVWAGYRAWTETDHVARRRFWAVAGLLAGAAMACKYPALISAVIPFGALALTDAVRRRCPRPLLAFTIGWAVVMAPWLGKNVVDTGNPVYPLAYKIFRGRYWDPAMDAKFWHPNAHGPKPITAKEFRGSVLDVAGRSDWQSPLYVALAPLAFLRRGSRRFAGAVAGYVVYLFLTWWLFTHRLDRFWLPLLPGLAMLAGLGADWSRQLGWSILLWLMIGVATLANLSYSTTALTALNQWTDDLLELRTAVPRMLNPALARVDASLPPGAKLLLVGQAAVFHVNHPIIYNTVFDDETFETLDRGRAPAEVRDALNRLGVTHVYVDWFDIARFRSPGNYGFTDFVQSAEFDRLVRAGVLERPELIGAQRELYRVRP